MCSKPISIPILSDRVIEQFPSRIINIHHSFLPAFAGARPYHQAHQRGVKLIGATAHYVTAELDQGPIVLDSRMVNLRGQFAIITLFEAKDEAATGLRRSLPALAERMRLCLTLVDAQSPARPVSGIPFRLKTYSMDQPGIVYRVSEVLRIFGVNIEDLSTRQESAPFMGTTLFQMEMRLTVPSDVAIRELQSRLQSLCDSLNCDVDFEPA